MFAQFLPAVRAPAESNTRMVGRQNLFVLYAMPPVSFASERLLPAVPYYDSEGVWGQRPHD